MNNEPETYLRPYLDLMSEVRDKVEKIYGLVNAIPKMTDDSTVGVIVDTIRVSLDDIKDKIFVCSSGIEVLSEELVGKTKEKMNKRTFDGKCSNGMQESDSYIPCWRSL